MRRGRRYGISEEKNELLQNDENNMRYPSGRHTGTKQAYAPKAKDVKHLP